MHEADSEPTLWFPTHISVSHSPVYHHSVRCNILAKNTPTMMISEFCLGSLQKS